MWVSFTHTFATYVLVKAGLFGCLAMAAYLGSLVPPLLRLVRRDAALGAALLPPLALGLFVHTSFKYLCFGLVLSILVLAESMHQDLLKRSACD